MKKRNKRYVCSKYSSKIEEFCYYWHWKSILFISILLYISSIIITGFWMHYLNKSFMYMLSMNISFLFVISSFILNKVFVLVPNSLLSEAAMMISLIALDINMIYELYNVF